MPTRRLGSFFLSTSVLLAATCFAVFAASSVRLHGTDDVSARSIFSSSNGLTIGSKVNVAGVDVGEVTSVVLDPQSDLSVVTFTRPRRLQIPADSSLSIHGGGPSGAATLSIDPGRSSEALQKGVTITRTTPATSLEDAIGAFIFGDGGLTETN